ncbi:hypothetical protein TNCV_1014271 [Trichonephila clavipes]|uniref:Uncharacterized protein n=1 Tax=Trichonephila clavipes TaxID=2585209 RepID=A0A8X7BB32_TRICX|nr:hypothetical protein TNCV_1014271 [Trichonephila clavipes]
MSEGRFDLSTFRSERTNEASTLTITPKRSSSRDVGTSSYRYHTATNIMAFPHEGKEGGDLRRLAWEMGLVVAEDLRILDTKQLILSVEGLHQLQVIIYAADGSSWSPSFIGSSPPSSLSSMDIPVPLGTPYRKQVSTCSTLPPKSPLLSSKARGFSPATSRSIMTLTDIL